MRFLRDFDPRVRGMFWSWNDSRPCTDTVRTLVRCWLQSRLRRLRPESAAAGMATVREVELRLKVPPQT